MCCFYNSVLLLIPAYKTSVYIQDTAYKTLFVYIGYICSASIAFFGFFFLSYGRNYSAFSLKSRLIYDFPTIPHPPLVSVVPVFKLEKHCPSFNMHFCK